MGIHRSAVGAPPGPAGSALQAGGTAELSWPAVPRALASRWLWAGVAAAAVLLAVRLRLPYGFSPSDEGFALTSASRYVLGDLPFRDEVYGAGRSSDVLLALLMRLLPLDSVLVWRWAGFAMQALALLPLAALLRRWLPFGNVTLLVAALALFTPFNLWTPQYANTGLLMALGGTSLWLLGATSEPQRRSQIAGFAGGLVLGLGVAVYLPFAILIACPLLAAAVPPRFAGGDRLRRASLAAGAGAATGLVLLAAALALSGLWGDFWSALAGIARQREDVGVADVQRDLAGALLFRARAAGTNNLLNMAAGGVCGTMLGALAVGLAPGRRRTALWTLAAGLLLAALFRFAVLPDAATYRTLSPRFSLISLSVLGLGLGASAIGAWRLAQAPALETRGDAWRERLAAAVALFGTALLAAVTATLASANGLAEVNAGAWLLWPGAVAALAALAQGRVERRVVLPALSMLLLLAAAAHMYTWTYEDGPIASLSARFQSPKLAGIYSSPEHVRRLDIVLARIGQEVGPGDFLLVYGNIAGIPYLTSTRPATRSTLRPSAAEMQRWIDEMAARGRLPRLAVTSEPLTGANPMERWIAATFDPIFTEDDLVIWRRRG